MEEKSLTAKQELFCQEYLVDLNQTQSYIRAYKTKDYIPTVGVAKVEGCRHLTNPNIQDRIADLMATRAKRCQVTQDEVILELKRCGMSDMRKFAIWNENSVTLEDSQLLDEDDARCVSSVSKTTTKDGGSISFKLHDKVKALELLGKHIGLFPTNVNLGGQKDNPLFPEMDVSVLSESEKENAWTAIQKARECQQQQPKE